MKKFLFFVLAVMLIGSVTSLYADHAKLMPENVGRVYIAPTYASQTQYFNKDGDRKFAERVITSGSPQPVYEMWNIGLAVEHGVTSWMTAALQWTPGYNIHSKVGTFGEATDLNDMGDLFVGAKIQLVGNTALLAPSEDIRFAFAPGIKVPLTKIDFSKEVSKANTPPAGSDDFTINKIDKHVLAAGWRLYFDYLFTKEFFVNFYNETIFYVQKAKAKNHSFGAATALASGSAAGLSIGDVDYKYQLTFEVEPNYTMEFTPKTTIEFGLPISYVLNPAPEFGDISDNIGGAVAAGTKVAMKETNPSSKVITVKPTIGIFFMDWALPIEFKIGYFMPVWGKNANATNTFSSQIRVYYKI